MKEMNALEAIRWIMAKYGGGVLCFCVRGTTESEFTFFAGDSRAVGLNLVQLAIDLQLKIFYAHSLEDERPTL